MKERGHPSPSPMLIVFSASLSHSLVEVKLTPPLAWRHKKDSGIQNRPIENYSPNTPLIIKRDDKLIRNLTIVV